MFIFSCFIYYKCIKFYILFDCSILFVIIESVRCYDDGVELVNSAIRLTRNFFSMRAGTKNEISSKCFNYNITFLQPLLPPPKYTFFFTTNSLPSNKF